MLFSKIPMIEYQVEYGPYRFFPKSNSVKELMCEIPSILRKIYFLNGKCNDWAALVISSNGERYEILKESSNLIRLRLMEFKIEGKNSLEEKTK